MSGFQTGSGSSMKNPQAGSQRLEGDLNLSRMGRAYARRCKRRGRIGEKRVW